MLVYPCIEFRDDLIEQLVSVHQNARADLHRAGSQHNAFENVLSGSDPAHRGNVAVGALFERSDRGHRNGIDRSSGISAECRNTGSPLFAIHAPQRFQALDRADRFRARALDRLGDGLLVPLRDTFASVAADGAALPLLVGLLGAAALRRREIP